LILKDKLKNIKFPKNALIGGVIRGNISFIAKGSTTFLPNDKVIVFALPEAIKKVNALFKER